jgi:UDP-N-acetylmuramoylalanine--D-glutamate ligase
MENYISSKFRITLNQQEEDVFIWCLDDEITRNNINRYPIKSTLYPISMKKELPQGAYISNAAMHLKWKGEEMQMSIQDFAIKGKHNQYNSMAASLASVAVDIKKEHVRESLQTFQSLEHRMEPVATIKGVEFINDSKATNVNSTWFALESMTSPTILILGGVDKGNDYTVLQELVKEKVKAIVCMGTGQQEDSRSIWFHCFFNGKYFNGYRSSTGSFSFCQQRRCGVVKPSLCQFRPV